MRLLGEYLLAGTTARSPWFRAFGDQARFCLEIIAITRFEWPDLIITVYVETKNNDEDDSTASTLTGGIGGATIGVQAATFSGFKELLRFKYVVGYKNPTHTGNDSIHLRMLPPLWVENRSCCCLEEQIAQETGTIC